MHGTEAWHGILARWQASGLLCVGTRWNGRIVTERPVCMLWMSGSCITVHRPRRQSHLLRGIQDDTRPIDIIVAHDIHPTTVEVLPLSLKQDATSRTTGQGN